jgi:hypothetical protein
MNPGTEAVKRYDRQRQQDRHEQAYLREVRTRDMNSDNWTPAEDEKLQRDMKAETRERHPEWFA